MSADPTDRGRSGGRRREPEITPELIAEHGLSEDEYRDLLAHLGREPSYTELGIVSAMWSEHCSYKSSRRHLRTLPTEGERVIQGPGENAGVVDIGDGQAVVFKMESHNHPSFIEPYQGAATGVGGICRDVFTMGARPLALADCLRFGRPDSARMRYLLRGVVSGIAGYGNSFGVPTVAGDVKFDASYDGNILVNAFCLGVVRSDRVFLAAAAGVGNPVLYVGAKTGRDGIHGATMASAEFSADEDQGDEVTGHADAESKRPTVQVGDPFMEKLLLEACLELMDSDLLVGVQDMGAAGLTSSAVEMAARAGLGLDLDTERVPCRETAMTPYEMLLSESQERMLMVVERGREDEALAVFARWDLDAAVIGRVTDTGRLIVRQHGQVYADLPVDFLAEGLSYDRPHSRPAYLDDLATFARPEPADSPALGQHLLTLLGSPDIASKEWVFGQYDYNVRTGTVVRPGAADAAVIRIPPPTGGPGPGIDAAAGGSASDDRIAKAVAISAGCQARHVYLAPYEGTILVVAEAYANLTAVGAEPIAVTNCLNFGNPERPGIMWQLVESIRGLGDACRIFDTPVVSGNVSLYNETDGSAIRPTPMIAMVGLMPDARAHQTMDFKAPGHAVAVVGPIAGSLAGSDYLARIAGREAGIPAPFDSDRDLPAFAAVRAMIAAGLLESAHDISEGGLAVAIAESAVCGAEPLGATIAIPAQPAPTGTGSAIPPSAEDILFGEAPARFVISYQPDRADAIAELAASHGAPMTAIGHTGGPAIAIELSAPANAVRVTVPIAAAHAAYTGGFRAAVE
ncbi:MAG: phosphoribosylformylglycinamidine synthase subunit PurL [Myxococcota bacterium]